jgi:hypothetical protein
MRTSFHHQPEAQHPKSPAVYTPAGRLPHLSAISDQRTAAIKVDNHKLHREGVSAFHATVISMALSTASGAITSSRL